MSDFASLIQDCAPNVAPTVVAAIIRTESGFDPLALHVNGHFRLRSAPRTAAQAAVWAQWLIDRGYSVDLGLMQVNSRNLTSLNLTPALAFEPCWNIRAGAALLTAQYGRAALASGAGTHALLEAISAYNTGTWSGGFHNGYVGKVVMNASGERGNRTIAPTCGPSGCPPHAVIRVRSSPYTADSAVGGFSAKP
jgi:type IV secretion system protein VirB1